MTEKQALHCMKFNCELAVCDECDVYGTVGTDHCFDDACREAIKALEKQIPKLVDNDGMRIPFSYYCPSCKEELTDDGYTDEDIKYCPNCGQAIKWE